jgi:hypothetical protein
VIKGAFVEIVEGMSGAFPNVVIFQFNPETMRHTWGQPAPGAGGQPGGHAMAVPGAPSESFSFSLSMDITDKLADPSTEQDAKKTGLYPRLAALELLVFPAGTAIPSAPPAGPKKKTRTTPAAVLPTVLFVWGSGRILPVRVTSLAITEKLYDANLNPTHAEAQVELRVLTPLDLRSVKGALGETALAAYNYSLGKRVGLAVANLGDAARAVIGIVQQSIPPR